jgi:hypothetical protein
MFPAGLRILLTNMRGIAAHTTCSQLVARCVVLQHLLGVTTLHHPPLSSHRLPFRHLSLLPRFRHRTQTRASLGWHLQSPYRPGNRQSLSCEMPTCFRCCSLPSLLFRLHPHPLHRLTGPLLVMCFAKGENEGMSNLQIHAWRLRPRRLLISLSSCTKYRQARRSSAARFAKSKIPSQ